jgi:hypothetical protein
MGSGLLLIFGSFGTTFFSTFGTTLGTTFFSAIGMTLLPAIIITRLDNAALIAQILHVTDIVVLFRYGQLIYVQAFAGISQTWSLGSLADLASLEKLDPFIQIVHRQLIKVVHAEQIILREYVSGFAISLATLRDFITEEEFTLSVGEFQDILAENEKGEFIIFEIQNTREHTYFHRMLYGVSKVITDNISLGDDYDKVRKVYSINIVFAWLGVICFMIPLFMAVFGWSFDVPWHWAYPVEIEPWKAQFAFGLYGIMLTSLIVGVLLTIFYRPRTWCVFCPMGNMTQLICKLKAR